LRVNDLRPCRDGKLVIHLPRDHRD
jgi:hypothetical protein